MYIVNFKKIREMLRASSTLENKENEIVEPYGPSEDSQDGQIYLQNKTLHEVKTYGNGGEDSMIFEFIRMLLERVISSGAQSVPEMSFSEQIALNTLIENDIIIEVNEKINE